MNGEPTEAEAPEETARWLVLDGAPWLTGEAAGAMVQVLCALVEAIEEEYAPEIEGHRRRRERERDRRRDPEAPWRVRAREPERQLRLDLDDEEILF